MYCGSRLSGSAGAKSINPNSKEITTGSFREFYTPAELGCLWNFGTVGANETSATILDLARRGYLEIEAMTQEEKVLGGLFGTKTSTDYVLKLTNRGTGFLREKDGNRYAQTQSTTNTVPWTQAA